MVMDPRERIAAATAICVWVGCNSVASARATVLNQTWACSNLSHETYWPKQIESKQLRCATVPVTSIVFPDVKKKTVRVYQRRCTPSCTLFFCSCLLVVPRKKDVQISFVRIKRGLRRLMLLLVSKKSRRNVNVDLHVQPRLNFIFYRRSIKFCGWQKHVVAIVALEPKQ